MVVHPAPGHLGGTLVNALLYHCGGAAGLSSENGALRPGIVHRLDKDTSGLIAAAKNDRTHRHLAAQLADHSMRRIYRAVVLNNIKRDRFTVDLPIGRHPADRKRMAVIADSAKKSRNAVTHVTVLERFGLFTLIEARLETGRTHQIRVHMAHMGHPLLGDTIYGPERQPYNIEGQILHAQSLRLTHPATGEEMEFYTELPAYFVDVLSKIKR
jgi:23S rRNA pseudouridine1911/1915/1917 synthase